MKHIIIVLLLAIISVNNFSCKKSDTITDLPSISSDNNKQVGASANDLLSAATYTAVKIEIQYMPGFAPDAAAINNLNSFFYNLNTLKANNFQAFSKCRYTFYQYYSYQIVILMIWQLLSLRSKEILEN